MTWQYLDLLDYLLIAEEILGVPATTLAQLDRIDLADSALNAPAAGFGEVDAYPAFPMKAAFQGIHEEYDRTLADLTAPKYSTPGGRIKVEKKLAELTTLSPPSTTATVVARHFV